MIFLSNPKLMDYSILLPNELLLKDCYLSRGELKALFSLLALSPITNEGKRQKTSEVNKRDFFSLFYFQCPGNKKIAREELFKLTSKGWLSPESVDCSPILSGVDWKEKKKTFTFTFNEEFLKLMDLKVIEKDSASVWVDYSSINLFYLTNDQRGNSFKLVLKFKAWMKGREKFSKLVNFEEIKEMLQIPDDSYLKAGVFSPILFKNSLLNSSLKKIEEEGEFSNLEVSIDENKKTFLFEGSKGSFYNSKQKELKEDKKESLEEIKKEESENKSPTLEEGWEEPVFFRHPQKENDLKRPQARIIYFWHDEFSQGRPFCHRCYEWSNVYEYSGHSALTDCCNSTFSLIKENLKIEERKTLVQKLRKEGLVSEEEGDGSNNLEAEYWRRFKKLNPHIKMSDLGKEDF